MLTATRVIPGLGRHPLDLVMWSTDQLTSPSPLGISRCPWPLAIAFGD